MKLYNRSRRMFLQGAGITALGIPWLPTLVGEALADDAPAVRRLVLLSSPYGQSRTQWFPPDENRTLSPVSERAASMPLADLDGDISSAFTAASWDPLRSQMLFLDGIDGRGTTGHFKTYPLTGYRPNEDNDLPPGASIDQLISAHPGVYPNEPLFRSVNVANGEADNLHGGSSLSYHRGPQGVTPVPQMTDAAAMWQLVFSELADLEGGEMAFEELRARKLSVIDAVYSDFANTLASPKLASADRLKLEAYAQHLRDYESSIEGWAYSPCEPPGLPSVDYESDEDRIVRQPGHHIANIIAMLRCDLTRVVVYSLAAGSFRYRNLGLSGHHHGLTHQIDAWKNGDLGRIGEFQATYVADLLKGLDVVEDFETGRTYLDNSIVLWTSAMGSVANHQGPRLPCMLFGGRDVLRRGTLIDFRSEYERLDHEETERVGVCYNWLLVTLCQLFGLHPEDYEQGQDGIGDYEGFEKYGKVFPSQEAYEAYAIGDKKSMLTELLA